MRFLEHSGEDLLFARLGSAQRSHPEEYKRTMDELKESGVEVVIRPGTLAFSPAKGEPGRMILDPEASIAAIRHEFKHFLDHRAAQYPGYRPYYEDVNMFVRLEVRGYFEEIRTARETGNQDLIPAIVQQLRNRIDELLGQGQR